MRLLANSAFINEKNKLLKCKIIVRECQAFIISFTPLSILTYDLFLMRLLHKFTKKYIKKIVGIEKALL